MNIILYPFFTLLLFLFARKIPFPVKKTTTDGPAKGSLFDAETTIALVFCAATKGIILGAPVASILYGGLSTLDRSKVAIPLVLYQGTQVGKYKRQTDVC